MLAAYGLAVAGAECSTFIELKLAHHAAEPVVAGTITSYLTRQHRPT